MQQRSGTRGPPWAAGGGGRRQAGRLSTISGRWASHTSATGKLAGVGVQTDSRGRRRSRGVPDAGGAHISQSIASSPEHGDGGVHGCCYALSGAHGRQQAATATAAYQEMKLQRESIRGARGGTGPVSGNMSDARRSALGGGPIGLGPRPETDGSYRHATPNVPRHAVGACASSPRPQHPTRAPRGLPIYHHHHHRRHNSSALPPPPARRLPVRAPAPAPAPALFPLSPPTRPHGLVRVAYARAHPNARPAWHALYPYRRVPWGPQLRLLSHQC